MSLHKVTIGTLCNRNQYKNILINPDHNRGTAGSTPLAELFGQLNRPEVFTQDFQAFGSGVSSAYTI